MKTIKIETTRIPRSVLLLALISAPCISAVERPSDLDEKPHQLELQPGQVVPLDENQARLAEEEFQHVQEGGAILGALLGNVVPAPKEDVAQAQPVVPYLGVGSTPVDELLSGHLGINHGVVVQQVHQDSGAFKAGLRKNDILLSFDGKKISSPLDLRDAVRERQVGDEVAVELMRKGQRQQEKVVLETRPDGLPGFVPPGGLRGMGKLQQIWPDVGQVPADAQEEMNKLRKMFNKEFNGIGLGLKLNDLLEGDVPFGDGQIDLNVDAQSTVTWSDEHGSITMNMRENQTEVEVRDHKGDIVYEGPWDTPQDKAVVDPEVRERIENMGVQKQGNQLKFWMEGLPGGP